MVVYKQSVSFTEDQERQAEITAGIGSGDGDGPVATPPTRARSVLP